MLLTYILNYNQSFKVDTLNFNIPFTVLRKAKQETVFFRPFLQFIAAPRTARYVDIFNTPTVWWRQLSVGVPETQII